MRFSVSDGGRIPESVCKAPRRPLSQTVSGMVFIHTLEAKV